MAWLHQASSPERTKRDALTAWESILPRLLDHPHLIPTYSDPATYEQCLSTYARMVDEPDARIRGFLSDIMNEWDCHPNASCHPFGIQENTGSAGSGPGAEELKIVNFREG